MKKLKAFIASLFLLAFIGCSTLPSSPPLTSIPSVPERAQTSQRDIILLPSENFESLLEEHALAYPDPFSQEYPAIMSIPDLKQYVGNKLYFLSDEETPFVGKGNTSQTPYPIINKLYSYNFEEKKKEEIGPFFAENLISTDFLLTDDAFYYFPLSISNAEIAFLYLRELSRTSKKTQDLIEIKNGNINVYSGQLRDGTVLFLVNFLENNKRAQRIYKEKENAPLSIIYDSEKEGLMEPEFSALTVFENSIFLLKQSTQDGKLESRIVEINANGQQLREIDLPDLNTYSDPEYYADKLYVYDNFFFIKWYYCGEELPYFSAYHLVNNRAETIDFMWNTPCNLLTKNLIESRYLVFSAFPDNMDYQAKKYTAHLFLFDIQECSFIGIHFPFPASTQISQLLCNEKGDLLMSIYDSNDGSQSVHQDLLKVDFEAIRKLL